MEVSTEIRFVDELVCRKNKGTELIKFCELLTGLTAAFRFMSCEILRVPLCTPKVPDGLNFVNDGVERRYKGMDGSRAWRRRTCVAELLVMEEPFCGKKAAKKVIPP